MKKFYQPKGGTKGNYTLRKNTYKRTWYLIADYPYYKYLESKSTVKGIAEDTFSYEAGRERSKEEYIRYIAAIEDAKEQIPPAYADHIMSHIIERKRYKDMDDVSEKTLKIWTQRFLWHVAHNLGEV